MKFVFTAYDKAIVAAILGPVIVFATSYINGVQFVWPRDYIAAAVAAIVAGLGVYLKGNATPTPIA